MPLELPNLDDLTYDDLLAEAYSLIPIYDPEWTNHNPSDPGITLIELFAYMTEILLYRLNRVTDSNKEAFLKLINGPDYQRKHQNLNDEIRYTVKELRQPSRAVTSEDFEQLLLTADQTDDDVKKSQQKVARVCCIPERNLYSENLLDPKEKKEKAGHVSIVIVPALKEEDKPQPNTELISAVKKYLKEHKLLTTIVHVIGPRYVDIGVHFEIHPHPDAPDNLEKEVRKKLKNYFDPLKGGREAKGWEFGRNIYVSEIYQLFDQLPGIDYVKRINNQRELTVRNPQNPEQELEDSNRLIKKDDHLIGISLEQEELVSLTKKVELKFEFGSSIDLS